MLGNFHNDFPHGQGRRVNKLGDVVYEGANWRDHCVPQTAEERRETELRKKARKAAKKASVVRAAAVGKTVGVNAVPASEPDAERTEEKVCIDLFDGDGEK